MVYSSLALDSPLFSRLNSIRDHSAAIQGKVTPHRTSPPVPIPTEKIMTLWSQLKEKGCSALSLYSDLLVQDLDSYIRVALRIEEEDQRSANALSEVYP